MLKEERILLKKSSKNFYSLRWIYSPYITALALFVQASFGPIKLMVFHEDNSVLCSHLVKSLKVVSTSQSKKLIWLFSIFSTASCLPWDSLPYKWNMKAYSFYSDRAKAFSVIICVVHGEISEWGLTLAKRYSIEVVEFNKSLL